LHLSPKSAQRLAAVSTAIVAVLAAITILILTGALRFNPNDPLAEVVSASHEVEYTIPGPVVNAIYLGFTTLAFGVIGVVSPLLLFAAERLFRRRFRLRRTLFKFWGVGAAASAVASIALVYAAHRPGLAPIAASIAAVGGAGAATPVFLVWYFFSVSIGAGTSFGESGA
jgi:hypothetical protein